MMLRVVLVAAGFTIISPAYAWKPTYPIPDLISRYYAMNEICRGGDQEEKSVQYACEQRELYATDLRIAGYCFLVKGKDLSYAHWHKCSKVKNAEPDYEENGLDAPE